MNRSYTTPYTPSFAAPYQPLRPIITIGVNERPDGVIHYLPYTFGVRPPYVDPPPASPEAAANQAYADGALEGAWRVGTAGFIVGLSAGLLGMLLFGRKAR